MNNDPTGVTLESWKDLQLLRCEPLLSSFVAFRDQRGSRVEHHISELAKALLSRAYPGWRRVLNDWLRLAFLPGPSDNRRHKRVKLTKDKAVLFVSCYWRLELNDDQTAREIVNQARHEAGYASNVPDCRGIPEILNTKRTLGDAHRPPAKRLKGGVTPIPIIKKEETSSLTRTPSPDSLSDSSESSLTLPPLMGQTCSFHTPQRRSQPWKTAYFQSPPVEGSLSPLHHIQKASVTPPHLMPGLLTPLPLRHIQKASVTSPHLAPGLPTPSPLRHIQKASVKTPQLALGLPTPPPSLRKVSQNREKSLELFPSFVPLLALPPNPINLAKSRIKMSEASLAEITDQLTPPAPDVHLWSPRDFIPNKLPMPMYPPIWAQSRQEVCESTSWFRSYQSGVYHCDGKVKGYLLGGFPSFRDAFLHGGMLIISHGGGKADSLHSAKGQLLRVTDEDQLAQDKSVRALLANYRSKTPLVLLIDDKYAFFPYNLASKDVTYAVLGVYLITHAWVEYDPSKSNVKGKVARHKFAFQWCQGQGEPWWLAPTKSEPTTETKVRDTDVEMKDDTAIVTESVSVTNTPGMPLEESQLSDCMTVPAVVLTQGDVSIPDVYSATPVDCLISDMSLSPLSTPLSKPSDMSMWPEPTLRSEARPPVHAIQLSCLMNPLVFESPDLKPRSPPNSLYNHPSGFIEGQCSMCTHSSPQIYEPEWTCLQSDCSEFWKSSSGEDFKPVAFHPRFMHLQENATSSREYEDIRPPVPATHADDPTSAIFTRGWHCRGCGRLSCRSRWEAWECDGCHTELKISMPVRSLSLFINIPIPGRRIENDFQIHPSSGIECAASAAFTYGDIDNNWVGSLTTYTLPDNLGKIHHIRGCKDDQEAEKIFDEYQEQASDGRLNFRRWPMRAHKCRGKLLTNYFSQNCGEPYHYVGGTENTLPFDKAASAVINAQQLIQKRVSQALGRNEVFNEILSAAYMENQKMAFHSDAERGLGPVVAGLSLGSPAVMHFRSIRKPVSQDRRVIALSVVLKHGDVLVMDGADIQNFYQHTVIPSNFRIAATARYINPAHAPPASMNVDVKPPIALGTDDCKPIVQTVNP